MSSAHALSPQGWRQLALPTENDRFKSRYDRYLTAALVLSLAVWANVFLFTPELEIEPYRMKQEITDIIVIGPPEVIVRPPREIPRPPVAIEPVSELEMEDPVQIAPSIWDEMPIFEPPGEGDGRIPGFRAFDSKPELVRFVPPVYPEFAREAGFSGVVYVDVLVGTDGRVKEARLQRGVHPLLDQASIEAARRARFTAGRQRDVPVEVWVTLPYGFVLN
jgi:protein TonB